MAKLLYFDPFNGISGDMILGALVDLGVPLEHLREQLEGLGLDGWRIECRRVGRQGMYGQDLRVLAEEDHHHRGFAQIRDLIESSALPKRVKGRAVAIFRRLGEAEAQVHGSTLEEIHFHEVGALDSIIDIVGTCIALDHLQAERFYTSPVCTGFGTVEFSHGTWPVPSPAAAALLEGFAVYPGETEAEMTTPTGAAVLAELCEAAPMPAARLCKSGFGAGDREFENVPNMLRVLLAEPAEEGAFAYAPASEEEDEVAVLETNLDDQDPQLCGHFLELALEGGALDVFYTPVHMKKNRPGLLLTLLCRPADRERFIDLIFRETSTLGVRWRTMRRAILRREVRQIQTEWGALQVKVASRNGETLQVAPEFEDLRRMAKEHGIPLKVLRRRVLDQLESID